MSYNHTQKDIEILFQSKENIYIKINLLNKDLKIIESLDGDLISDDYTIDSESDIRRTINLTLYVRNSSFLIGYDKKIWIDRYVEVYYGILHQRTQKVIYYPMGTYLFNESGYEYSSTNKTLSISCVDLMANFTGLRNGQVMGLTTEIPAGSDIRDSIVKTLTHLGNYNKYRIDNRANSEKDKNLFNISNANNIFHNCNTDGNKISCNIPSGENECYIEYYSTRYFQTNKTYTFSFKKNDSISGYKIKIIVYGKENENEKNQEFISQTNKNILSFNIDSSFTEITYIKISPVYFDNNVSGSKTFDLEEIAIYDGNFNNDNLPSYIDFNNKKEVPYDLKFSAGATVYEILSELNNLESGWEMFFDTDNTFINQKIPTTKDDRYVIDWETLDKIVIDESIDTNFSDIKNSTRIWGKCLDADRTIDDCTNENNVYILNIPDIIPEGNDDIPYGTNIAFKANVNNLKDMKIKVKDTSEGSSFEATYPIVNDGDIPIEANKIIKDSYYVVKYRSKKFYFLGQFQIVYVVKEYNNLPLKDGQTKEEFIEEDKKKEGTNNVKYIINSENIPETYNNDDYYNRFAIDEIGEIRQVLSGGDYDLIYTDDLARQRAEYENWKSMRLNITLNLTIKPILWLDVNQKIQYKSNTTNTIDEYIIKSINGSITNGYISIEAIKFYPLYPFIVED